jgi:ATP-dependent protease HslVU (ClpYQ) ATPase subunit
MERRLDGLRQHYGDRQLRCTDCGETVPVIDVIEAIEQQEVDTIFTAEKIQDLAFRRCEDCGRLRLHEVEEYAQNQDTGATDASESTRDNNEVPSDSIGVVGV